MRFTLSSYLDWHASAVALRNITLDAQLYVGTNNNPSIIPQNDVTSTTSSTGSTVVSPPGIGTGWNLSAGNQWKTGGLYGYTAGAQDSVTWTVSGIIYLKIQLTGVVASGQGASSGTISSHMISHGAIATVTITPAGEPASVYSFDCYQATPALSVYLSAALSYTISIAHSGTWNSALGPTPAYTEIGIVSVTTGTGTTAGLSQINLTVPGVFDKTTYWSIVWWEQSGLNDIASVSVNGGVASAPFVLYQLYNDRYIGIAAIATRSDTCSLLLSFSGMPSLTSYWVRNMNVHYWIPETDTFYTSQMGLPQKSKWGAALLALQTGIEIALELAQQDALDLLASTSITTAVSPYIEMYGDDLELLRFTGEPIITYRSRLKAFLAQDRNGVSASGLANQITIMTGVTPTITVTAPMTMTFSLRSSGSLLGILAGIPSAQLNAMIVSLVETLLPAGVIVSSYTFT